MADEDEWDVIVVGAGPAGSSAAQAAASKGTRVLMVDRRVIIGSPVQCAEFLARPVVHELRLPREVIAQDVERTLTHVMGEEASVRRNPGCIIHRDLTDLLLARRAEEAGAIVWAATRVTGIENLPDGRLRVHMDRGDGPESTCADLVVGADGPRSTVGAAMGNKNQQMVVAHQVTVRLPEPREDTEVYLDPAFKGGYAWMFPKADLANVGVGVDASMGTNPKAALSVFLANLGDRVGEELRSTGGLIPVGGPLPHAMGRVLLAGDAAGHTHPITGGGIHQAVVAGRLAGEAAAAFTDGDCDALVNYGIAFKSLFGLHLDRALARRKEMLVAWPDAEGDPEAFHQLARRGWIGFPEYYRKRGDERDG
jgi:geranylgeranyl reductase family protein